MTDQLAPASRPKTLAAQALVNRLVRALLRTPLLARLAGSRLITVYVTGRKSGRRYAIPVAYTSHEDDLLIGTSFAWGRNLRTGDQVTIRLAGRRRPANVVVLTEEQAVTDAYAIMSRHNHAFANFNNIGFAPDGTPNPHDLHQAWTTGARAFRLLPQ
jgi:deazaflavin-dependent oxidoreductase (nitroreductase family)